MATVAGIDQRGPDYGFVLMSNGKRAVFAYEYPEPGLNVKSGNWGELTPRELEAARQHLLKHFNVPA